MKRYYVLGGDPFVSEDMALTTLVVDDKSRASASYDMGGDNGVIGRPLMKVDGNFKNTLTIESVPRKKLSQMNQSANCVFGATRLLTTSGAEFKRVLEQTRKPEAFVIVGEVYGVKDGEQTVYNRDDRVGYEVVLVRNANGKRALACAYKSVSALSDWLREDKKQSRYCVNASIDRSGANLTLRFKDASHDGVAMVFGIFKAPKPVKVETETVKTTTVKSVTTTEVVQEQKSPFTPEQLAELELGEQHGVDVSIYKDPSITAPRMKRFRHFMEKKSVSVENLKALAPKTGGMSDEIFDLYCRLAMSGDITPYVHDKIDVASVYTLYLEFTGSDPDRTWLERAKKKAGKDGMITEKVLNSAR